MANEEDELMKEFFETVDYVGDVPPWRDVPDEDTGDEYDDTPDDTTETIVALSDGVHHGLMVSLTVPPSVATSLQVLNGLTPDEMHVTLCYVSSDKLDVLSDDEIADLFTVVAGEAARIKPFSYDITGLGRFDASPSSDYLDVLYAKVESDALMAARAKIFKALSKASAEPKSNFTYTPHVTLAYIDPTDDEALDHDEVTPASVAATEITVTHNGIVETFALGSVFASQSSAVAALNRLPVVGTPPDTSVRSTDVFKQPLSQVACALNRKTTSNDIARLDLALIAPTAELIPVAGLTRYISQPRKDAPDVCVIHMRSGQNLFVLQDGHTRVAAALLRGEPSMEMRAWAFEQNDHGGFSPVPRGMHKRGLSLSARFDMPDISDVSFPSVIGAIPAKRKRKKPVPYRGVSLGRKPTDFEAAIISLSDIPVRFDNDVEITAMALANVRRRHMRARAAEPQNGAQHDLAAWNEARQIMATAADDMARYGAFELRQECARQGMRLSVHEEDHAVYALTGDAQYQLEQRVLLSSDALHREWCANLSSVRHRLARTNQGVMKTIDLAETKVEWGLKSAVRAVLNESFSLSRREQMAWLVIAAEPDDTVSLARRLNEKKADKLVDYVIQTAVMDASTCDPCALADGTTFDYDDDEMHEYEPPFYKCLGGDHCRCVQVYVLTDGNHWVVRDGMVL